MQKNQTVRMRSNSFTGIVEDQLFDKFSMHFAESWSGNCIDFIVNETDSTTQKFYLSSQGLTWIAAVALATGMIELPEVKEKAEQLLLMR